MFRHFSALPVLLVMAVVLYCGDLACADDLASRKQDFLKAVAAMKAAVKDLKLHVETVERSHWVESGKPDKDTVTRHEMACRGPLRVIKRMAEDGVTEEIAAMNEKYYFILRSGPQGLELAELVPINSPKSIKDAEKSFDAIGSLGYVCAGYYGGQPWWEYVQMPGFAITDITPDERPDCFRIDYTTPTDAMPAPVVKNHYTVFDSSRDWVAVETGYDSYYPDAGKGKSYYDRYRFTHSDFVDLNGVEVNLKNMATTNASDKKFRDEVLVESTILSENPSEEMFYLSYYGLDEPNFERRRGLWYLVVLVVLAIIAYWISQRRKKQSR